MCFDQSRSRHIGLDGSPHRTQFGSFDPPSPFRIAAHVGSPSPFRIDLFCVLRHHVSQWTFRYCGIWLLLWGYSAITARYSEEEKSGNVIKLSADNHGSVSNMYVFGTDTLRSCSADIKRPVLFKRAFTLDACGVISLWSYCVMLRVFEVWTYVVCAKSHLWLFSYSSNKNQIRN